MLAPKFPNIKINIDKQKKIFIQSKFLRMTKSLSFYWRKLHVSDKDQGTAILIVEQSELNQTNKECDSFLSFWFSFICITRCL